MRVTDTGMYRFFLEQLDRNRTETHRGLDRLSDGKRIRRVSDDPAAANQALALRGRLVRTEGFRRSGQAARHQLETADRVLGEAVNLVTRAYTLATAAASDTQQSGATVAAGEIDQLRQQLLSLANTEYRDTYIFAGTRSLTAAFDPTGAYAGDTAETQAPIESGQAVGVTLDGSRIFQGAGDLFATLSNLSTAILAGDSATIRTSISELNAEIDQLALARGNVGNRLNRIGDTLVRLGDEQIQLQTRISELEDIRFEEVAVELSSLDTAYQALSSAGARIFGRSLFDYLG